MKKIYSCLNLEQLNFHVKLGCSTEESHLPQLISLRLSLRFDSLPKGCETDRLEDTLCYAKISESLQQYCEPRSFHLLESLGYQLYQLIKAQIDQSIEIKLVLTKQPPTPYLSHCDFTIGDWD